MHDLEKWGSAKRTLFCWGRPSTRPVMCCRFTSDVFGPPDGLETNPAIDCRRIRQFAEPLPASRCEQRPGLPSVEVMRTYGEGRIRERCQTAGLDMDDIILIL